MLVLNEDTTCNNILKLIECSKCSIELLEFENKINDLPELINNNTSTY
jgi:hypothetical protein